MKRRWFVVPLLVGLLTLGITGGTVLAQESGASGDTPAGKFAARVATILGLEETQVQDALKQAAREMRDEALQLKLDRMVENGLMTQEEADAYLEWYESRPEGDFPGLRHRGFGGGHGFFRGGMGGGHGMGFGHQMPAEPTPDTSVSTSL